MNDEDEICLGCKLMDKYKLLIDDGVDEEEALSFVIHTAMDIKDEEIADLVDSVYADAFEEGLRLGIEKSVKLLNDLVDYTDEQIADYRAEREAELNGELDKEESEEIEDISDEDFEKLTKIIFDSK